MSTYPRLLATAAGVGLAVALGCAADPDPGRPGPAPRAATFSNADYQRAVAQVRRRAPEGFNLTVEKPFIVVSDAPREELGRWASGTVRWAVRMIRADYFPRDPEHIITIWLFKGKESYRRHTREFFGEEPGTPFGYYSPRNRALIMNIATGGGTLVHEMVHPFMEANFPACPAWFNEGLASLYEQSGERGGKIVGFPNWRLPGLQKAIRANRLPSFRQLTATTTHQFYREDPGTNYAQARYLCYYLQEKGLLRTFYHKFHAAAAAPENPDHTGYRTLKEVLGLADEAAAAAFQVEWERYVLKLRFR